MRELKDLLQKAIETKHLKDWQMFMETLHTIIHPVMLDVVRRRFPLQAKDLTNEIFISKILVRPLHKFHSFVDAPKRYANRIAQNYCIDFHRQRKLIVDSLDAEQYENAAVYWPGQQADFDWSFLEKYLTKVQAKVVYYRFCESLEFEEIQRQLQLPSEEAVRKHLSRAMRKLKSVLTGKPVA